MFELPKERVLIALYYNALNHRVGMKRLDETSLAEREELSHLLEGMLNGTDFTIETRAGYFIEKIHTLIT